MTKTEFINYNLDPLYRRKVSPYNVNRICNHYLDYINDESNKHISLNSYYMYLIFCSNFEKPVKIVNLNKYFNEFSYKKFSDINMLIKKFKDSNICIENLMLSMNWN